MLILTSIFNPKSFPLKQTKIFAKSYLPILLLYFSVVCAIQLISGAYKADFGSHSDEGAHFVTGLMMRDYLASGNLNSPMRFAENYYVYYPKVAIGHWPPLFYITQAFWTLPFSPSRISILLLMAVLTSFLALTVYVLMRREFSVGGSIAGGLLLLSLPAIQMHSGMVMAEILMALFAFWAVICFYKYVETQRSIFSIAFGILASCAIMTKGTGLALAPFPVVALALSGRLDLLRRRSFWYPVAIVGLLCGPWYLLTLKMSQNGFLFPWGWGYISRAVPYYSWELVRIAGISLTILMLAGLVAKVVLSFRSISPKWAAFAALLLSVLLFQWIVPASLEGRHLITATPVVVLFIASGISWTASRLPFSLVGKSLMITIVAVMLYAAETFSIPTKSNHGYTRVAQSLLAKPELGKSVFMISSDSNGEGAFISEIARMENRPGHVIIRAFKVLSRNRWSDSEDNNVFQSATEIMEYLEKIPIGILVVDTTPEAMTIKHHQQLMDMVRDYKDRWELISSHPGRQQHGGPSSQILVYRLKGHENQPVNPVLIDMNFMLNRSLKAGGD